MVFRIHVKYEADAHPAQVIAVTANTVIRTREDAEKHCLKHLHHKDYATGRIYPCIEAKAEEGGPVDESLAPHVSPLQAAPKAPGGAA